MISSVPYRGLIVALAVLSTAAAAGRAAAEGCPEARTQRLAGDFKAAEAAGRLCLEDDADDVGTWFELSRVIGYQGRHAEALHWVQRGLERYPDDTDLGLWQVRLLAWMGRLPEARSSLAAIVARVPEVLQDRETAMLEVDLQFWGEAWGPAGDGFTRYLGSWPDDAEALRKRGITWLKRGDEAHAVLDFEASCALSNGDAASCRYMDDIRRGEAVASILLEPSFATGPGADEVITRLTGMVKVADGLRVGVGAELRHRSTAVDSATDTLLHVVGNYRAESFSAEAGVGVGISPTFAPALTAFVEPAVALSEAVWAHLRYWRLSFEDGGAHILAPAVNLYLGSLNLEARYYLGLVDGGDATHAGLLRARWGLTETVTLDLGAGAGTAADYLTTRDEAVDGHWLGMAGITWSPSWRHRIRAGYVHRQERSGGETLVRHEVYAAWELSL